MVFSAMVVDTSKSQYARLRPIPLNAVTLTDEFWAPRRQINRDVTLPAQFRHLEETDRLNNFRRAAGKINGPFVGIFFNDSDVYKWLEGASWSLATDPSSALEQLVDAAIAEIEDAQQPDGYLNTYFMFDKAAERWSNLRDLHELYCAGHLFQAAVAHRRATGSNRLLNVACRYADYICSVFGPEAEGKRPGACGHPEIEMAMVELARETGNEKYLKQAQFFIDIRGHGAAGGKAYHQDHQPLRGFKQMIGHAVRAVYLNAGATDLYLEAGDDTLRAALDGMWDNMVARQVYISGGIGARYEGEAFGKDYELPNERAYAETCAAIGSVMWSWRMLAAQGEACYADLIEHTLYNAVMPGISLDGQTYFYENPLADDGSHRRQPWFGCACCPPNVARTLASLPGYFYSLSAADSAAIWVHLYAEGMANINLADGRLVRLIQHTRYPWDGDIQIEVQGEGEFALCLRVPGWCMTGASLQVNGQSVDEPLTSGSYGEIRRTWHPGDLVHLTLPMPVRRIACHPYVFENAGRVALMRGPLLYCVEQADNPTINPRDLVLSNDDVVAERAPNLLGDVVVLRAWARTACPADVWTGKLYLPLSAVPAAAVGGVVALTAIPYYAWANRDAGCMQVWLRSEALDRK